MNKTRYTTQERKEWNWSYRYHVLYLGTKGNQDKAFRVMAELARIGV